MMPGKEMEKQMKTTPEDGPSVDRSPFVIDLSGSAIEVLKGLFVEGPLWDGDVPSKNGRDELVTFGLVTRLNGWQQLTKKGLGMALAAGLDRKKERHYRLRHKALNLLNAVDSVMNPPDLCKAEHATISDLMKWEKDEADKERE
jgi:hypothetical protein